VKSTYIQQSAPPFPFDEERLFNEKVIFSKEKLTEIERNLPPLLQELYRKVIDRPYGNLNENQKKLVGIYKAIAHKEGVPEFSQSRIFRTFAMREILEREYSNPQKV